MMVPVMNKKPNAALKYAVGFFLFIAVWGETAGQPAGTTGQVCIRNSFCLDRVNQVCDTNAAPPPKCKVKDKMGCHMTPDLCVSGANCIDNRVCSCNISVAVQLASGLCPPAARRVGGTCNTEDSESCHDPDAHCTTTTFAGARCQCRDGLTVNYQTYSCEIPVRKVGGDCVTSDATPCDDVNADCIGVPAKCRCRADFVANPRTLTCELAVGRNCSGRNALCATGTICDVNDYRCKFTHGRSCEAHNELCVTGAVCLVKTDSNPVCTCLSDPAARKVDGSCDVNDTIPCDDVNAVCTEPDWICTCRNGFTVNGTSLTCVPAARKVGGSCDVDDVTPCDDVNAICTGSLPICTCKDRLIVDESSLTCVATDGSNAMPPLTVGFLLLPLLWGLLFSLT